MTRTKWMRLGVRDPADILRWAGAQNICRLDEFRHRVIRGREFVSFRMTPRYAIQIGTADIVVVAYMQPGRTRRTVSACRTLWRRAARLAADAAAAVARQAAGQKPVRTAELYPFHAPRRLSQR